MAVACDSGSPMFVAVASVTLTRGRGFGLTWIGWGLVRFDRLVGSDQLIVVTEPSLANPDQLG